MMESEQWFEDRKAAENLLRALANLTPEVLKTLQDKELERITVLLAEVTAACGREHGDRASRPNRPS
jgi:hypothetical protein